MDYTGPYYIVLFICALLIIYADKLSAEIQTFPHTWYGILITIVFFVGLVIQGQTILAGLLLIFFFRTMASIRKNGYVNEGFVPGDVINHHIIEGSNRWFIEKIMKERPYLIEDSVVSTDAVQ
jgi:hypothetical protein